MIKSNIYNKVLWEKAWQVWIDRVMSGKSTLMKNPVLIETDPRFTNLIYNREYDDITVHDIRTVLSVHP